LALASIMNPRPEQQRKRPNCRGAHARAWLVGRRCWSNAFGNVHQRRCRDGSVSRRPTNDLLATRCNPHVPPSSAVNGAFADRDGPAKRAGVRGSVLLGLGLNSGAKVDRGSPGPRDAQAGGTSRRISAFLGRIRRRRLHPDGAAWFVAVCGV